jgi:hypothetical protein
LFWLLATCRLSFGFTGLVLCGRELRIRFLNFGLSLIEFCFSILDPFVLFLRSPLEPFLSALCCALLPSAGLGGFVGSVVGFLLCLCYFFRVNRAASIRS